MNSKLKEIFQKIDANKEELIKNGVEKIGIFGSYARGEEKEESDIDILIVFKSDYKNFSNFMKVNDILENSTRKKVDLVTPESLSPYIKPYIDKEVIYEAF